MAGPLENVRVLDMTWALAGPFCAMLLADLGAEVIKVENPEGGDTSRKNFPFVKEVSSYFLSVNRGKKSVTVNLRHPRGKEMVLSLAKKSDVLVENFRPGVMDRLGLGYAAVREVNPKIIYAACSGFGRTSPYAHRPAYDVIVQGMGGTLSITGEEGGPPVRVGFSIGDIGGGLFTALGILSAAREMITQVKHTQAGMLRVVNSPIKLSRTPVKLERASPVLGEHTEEVFMNLIGLSKEDLAKLREEKAI